MAIRSFTQMVSHVPFPEMGYNAPLTRPPYEGEVHGALPPGREVEKIVRGKPVPVFVRAVPVARGDRCALCHFSEEGDDCSLYSDPTAEVRIFGDTCWSGHHRYILASEAA